MSRGPTAVEVDAACRREELLDRWLIAGTSTGEPYPCWCRGDSACRSRCRCRGRHDWQAMPKLCCARRAGETKQRQETGSE
jgi:hypothetical protein